MEQSLALGASALCTALIAAAALKTPYPKGLTALATAAVSGWRIYRLKDENHPIAGGIANGLTHLTDVAIFLGLSRLLRRAPPATLLAKIGAGLGCAVWVTARLGSEWIFEGKHTIGGALVGVVVDIARKPPSPS